MKSSVSLTIILGFIWIQNSERLFFKNDTLQSSSNIRSLIRPSADLSRRNAYWRMFGMDLAFGDINSQSDSSIPIIIKQKKANLAIYSFCLKNICQKSGRVISMQEIHSGENRADVNVVS